MERKNNLAVCSRIGPGRLDPSQIQVFLYTCEQHVHNGNRMLDRILSLKHCCTRLYEGGEGGRKLVMKLLYESTLSKHIVGALRILRMPSAGSSAILPCRDQENLPGGSCILCPASCAGALLPQAPSASLPHDPPDLDLWPAIALPSLVFILNCASPGTPIRE